MTDKYEALRATLAAGPTDGPWRASTDENAEHVAMLCTSGIARFEIVSESDAPLADIAADAYFIAAANPETIRALLAERDELERALALAGKTNKALMDQHLADSKTLRDYAQQRDDLRKERDALLENGKQAVRWAPSSAHWSNELKRLFGEDARDGIDVLEAQLRAAQAERDALREALQKVRPVIAADRQALLDCHGNGNEIPAADKLGTLGLYEYDGALNAIDAALAQHQVGGAQ